MAAVSFYTGVADRLPYVCRLLRKAQQSGVHIGVCGPSSLLDALDLALWTFEAGEFVPHLRLKDHAAPAGALGQTSILLTETPSALPHRALLLNLGLGIPEGFGEFERVLEVVSRDVDQAESGRQRFKQYKSAGIEIAHHQVNA